MTSLVRFHNGFKAAAAEENLAINRTFQLRVRALKFLKFCCDKNGEAEEDVLASPNLIHYALGNAQLSAYLFLKVKSCRPMSYEHLTLRMFENERKNDGMVDQKIFKTAKRYGFDSVYFDESSINM